MANKVLRGSYGADGKQIQLLSALLHEEKIVVSQRQIETKSNEITEFNNLLKNLDIKDLLVTKNSGRQIALIDKFPRLKVSVDHFRKFLLK